MKAFHHLTRGGQIALHQYSMIRQVLAVTVALSFLGGVGLFGVLFMRETSTDDRYLCHQYYSAELNVVFCGNNPERAVQHFAEEGRPPRPVRSVDILGHKGIQRRVQAVEDQALELAQRSMMYGTALFGMIMALFGLVGHVKSRKKVERGGQVLDARALTRYIRRRKMASDLTLDGLPLLKNKETSHLLITGTTGAGKSNCLHTLLPQIRARGDRAIIVDLNGDYGARYYKDTDVLLNPLDDRSELWSPWAECHTDAHYDTLAAAILPKGAAHDTFWENAGKVVLSAALQKMADTPSIQELYHLLVEEDMGRFSAFFRGTAAAPYTHLEGEKMTLSIRATLANHVQSLRLLQETNRPFSVRGWVTSEESKAEPTTSPPWLFLSAKPDQRETLKPLISAWLETAITALMTLPPHNGKKLWFIIDELPALQRLPSLETALAESRKYGGCVLAGVQSFPQLTHLYGINQSQAILDLFNTKVFFRNTDPNTNQWICKVIGDVETTEPQESLSYGAHTMRDGVSLSYQTRMKPLVLPTEIAALTDLEAFVKLPGDYPVGRVRMGWRG